MKFFKQLKRSMVDMSFYHEKHTMKDSIIYYIKVMMLFAFLMSLMYSFVTFNSIKQITVPIVIENGSLTSTNEFLLNNFSLMNENYDLFAVDHSATHNKYLNVSSYMIFSDKGLLMRTQTGIQTLHYTYDFDLSNIQSLSGFFMILISFFIVVYALLFLSGLFTVIFLWVLVLMLISYLKKKINYKQTLIICLFSFPIYLLCSLFFGFLNLAIISILLPYLAYFYFVSQIVKTYE